jgi:hypothetical protein
MQRIFWPDQTDSFTGLNLSANRDLDRARYDGEDPGMGRFLGFFFSRHRIPERTLFVFLVFQCPRHRIMYASIKEAKKEC